jgi:hypothetical protein
MGQVVPALLYAQLFMTLSMVTSTMLIPGTMSVSNSALVQTLVAIAVGFDCGSFGA